MARVTRTGWVLAAVAAAAMAAVLIIIAGINPQLGSSPLDTAKRAAQSFADDAVAAGPWTDPAAAGRAHDQLQHQLRPAGLHAPVAVKVIELAEIDSSRQRATLSWAWLTNPRSRTQVPDWSYTSEVDVVKDQLSWKAEYRPEVVHPQLHDDAEITAEVEAAPRAKILGSGDEVLTSVEPVISVGVEPARTDDPAQTADDTAAALAGITDIDAQALTSRIEAAAEHAFVPVVTIRADDYRDIADELRPIPGTVFRSQDMSVPVHRGLAPLLLGRVGAATAEDLEEDPLLRDGDLVGQSGLQKLYQAELSGRAGVDLQVDGETILSVDAVPAPPVTTSIERDLQQRADEAAASAGAPVGIVVIDSVSGEVRAVANAGGDSGFDRALNGSYPDSPAHALTTALAKERGAAESEVLAALGIERVDLGMPAAVSTGGQPTGSPVSVAIAAARVLTGQQPAASLVQSAGGEDLPSPAPDESLTKDERQTLEELLEPHLVDLTGSAGTAEGETGTVGPWAIGQRGGLVAAVIVEPADDDPASAGAVLTEVLTGS
ncbi:hypothetical protein [Brevibacterium luteolum]|uniref:beta-lactamase n=1 Tax=Brevibacterium luteolum TaxID=199591 RepID=A0A849AP57_9MICO|nr:hypothetical protein [Brevibacterium luteolum]MBM7528800.1 hypothetical protein [Brevibacterium luteolum]NNG78998.1 hypothetical protein [Brevibacterium luteolum]